MTYAETTSAEPRNEFNQQHDKVVRDEIEAFKWFELAAKEGIGGLRDNAATARINIAARLTPMQVQMASVRAQNWMKTHRVDRIQ